MATVNLFKDYHLSFTRDVGLSEIVTSCSSTRAEELLGKIKMLSDADRQFANGFQAFIKADPDQRKEIHAADMQKAQDWKMDNDDSEEAVISNVGKINDKVAEIRALEAVHEESTSSLEKEFNAAKAKLEEKRTRLESNHAEEVDRCNSAHAAEITHCKVEIARWKDENSQHAKDIQGKATAGALLEPSLQIMETINAEKLFFRATLSTMETARKLVRMSTVNEVEEAVDQDDIAEEDTWGTKILISLATLGVNMHDIHGEGGIEINPMRVRRMPKAMQVRLICDCLNIGKAASGLFSVGIAMKIRTDQSEDRKRKLEADPESPVNKFRKRIKKAGDESPCKDHIAGARYVAAADSSASVQELDYVPAATAETGAATVQELGATAVHPTEDIGTAETGAATVQELGDAAVHPTEDIE